MKKKIALIATFVIGLYYFLEFLLPPFIGGDFDNIRMGDPCLVETDGGYRLYYMGTRSREGSGDARLAIGLVTSNDGAAWAKHPGNPLVARSMFSSKDWRGLSHPAVVPEPDGSYTMFYIGHGGRTGDCVLRATSRDGLKWTGRRVVLDLAETEHERVSTTALAVLREAHRYVAYFGGTYRRRGEVIQGVSRATSADGLTWALDENNPVLPIVKEGSWEYKSITDLSVVAADGELRLYYAGTKKYFLEGGKKVVSMTLVGFATSQDGIVWVRHAGNPVFGPALFERGLARYMDHLLNSGADAASDEETAVLLERFDAGAISGLSIVRGAGGYLLAYGGSRRPEKQDYQIGFATSDDGITWRAASEKPALALGREPRSTYLSEAKVSVSKVFIIVGAMALGLGLFGLVKLHGGRLAKREKGWIYSLGFFVSLVFTLFVAWNWGKEGSEGTGHKLYNIVYKGLLVSFGASSMGLLTFYLASASYRSFKLKSAEAGLMLIAAILVLLGQVPLGQMLTSWLPAALQIQNVTLWMSYTIVIPVMRAIQIGAAVGGLVLATRLWFSMEKRRA